MLGGEEMQSAGARRCLGNPQQTLFRCECESRLAVLCGSCACAGRSAVPAVGGGFHPARLYRLHTPANPTRRACGCRGTMLAIAWADARSYAPPPVYTRRGLRAVIDNSDLDVQLKIKIVTRLVCARAARAGLRATCVLGAEAVACSSYGSADRGGRGCMAEMQYTNDLLD